jgi:hypothetical protein
MDRGEAGRCFLHLVGDFAINSDAGQSQYISKKQFRNVTKVLATCAMSHDGFVHSMLERARGRTGQRPMRLNNYNAHEAATKWCQFADSSQPQDKFPAV